MAGILGGLALVGTILSNKLSPPETHDNKIKSTTRENVYNSNELSRNTNKIQKLADRKYELAENPSETGVIPKYYNVTSRSDDNVSSFSDECSNHSNMSDNRLPSEKGQDLIEKNKDAEHFINQKTNSKNTFLDQFEPMTFNSVSEPVAGNKAPRLTGNYSRLAMERELNLREGFSGCSEDMTYGVVPKDRMTHNNMTPAFRSKKGYGYSFEDHKHVNDLSQRKLEAFTGSANNLAYRPKTERKPLFNPLIGLTHIYGSPVMTSEMESRFIPSRERRNEKPFQEVKVTPGLGLGYTEIGKSGYHDPFRIREKTVNELRVRSKPKVSYKKPIIYQMKEARRPIDPEVLKRHPETFVEYGTTRMLPQYNQENAAPKIDGEYNQSNMATVNRGTEERVVHGHAQYTNLLSTPDALYPAVHESNRETFETDGPRNTAMVQAQQSRGFNESYNPTMTQRMQENEYIGPAYQDTKNMYVYDTIDNIPDPTMRNVHENVERYGNGVHQSEYNRSQAFDKINATPDPTMRNIHENVERYGNGVHQSEYNRSQAFDKINATPDPTMRNIHENVERYGSGVHQSEYNKPQAFDNFNAIPDPNMRNIHENVERYGGGVYQSGYNKPQAFDNFNAVPDPNMRNIHENVDRYGSGVHQSEYNKPQAFDALNAVPDPTMRNIHEDADRYGGGVYQSEYNKPQAFDALNAVPDPTMRNIHEDVDRYGGGVYQSEYNKPQAFDALNAVPDPTMRNIHEDVERYGNGALYHERQRSRADARNEYINVAKEKTIKGRAPTTCNYDKCPSMEGTIVQMCDPIQVDRDLYPDITQQVTPKVHTIYTRASHSLPNDEWRFNTHPKENMDDNPYVNNTQHKSFKKID